MILIELNSVSKCFTSNVETTNTDRSNKELWTIMKLCNGERLVDHVRNTRPNLRTALELTRRLLDIIKKMHARNVIHRDIQPKHILI